MNFFLRLYLSGIAALLAELAWAANRPLLSGFCFTLGVFLLLRR